MLVASLLVGLVAMGYSGQPQPWLLQKAVGLLAALLAGCVALLAAPEEDVPDEAEMQLLRGQQADFGRKLRQEQRERRTVRLPLVGATSIRRLAAGAAFAGALLWWWTPLSPMRVAAPPLPDITGLLSDAVATVVLVVPDGDLPVAAPPIVPAEAIRLAAEIPASADPLHRAQRAIAENRFDEARQLLDHLAASPEPGDPQASGLLRALADAFDMRFADAAGQFGKLALARPGSAPLRCQEAAAWLLAGRFNEADRALRQAAPDAGTPAPDVRSVAVTVPSLRAALAACRGKADRTAMDWLQQALQAWLAERNDRDPLVGAIANNQAVVYLLQARYADALALAQRARGVWEPAGDRRLPLVLANLATLEGRLAHADAAQQLAEEACRCWSAAGMEKHPLAALGNLTRAWLCLDRGDSPAAQKVLRDGMPLLEDRLGEKCVAVLPALRAAGRLAEQQAVPGHALTLRLRGVTLASEILGPEHPYGEVAVNDLCAFYVEQGVDANVETRLRQTLDRAEKAQRGRHPVVGQTHGILGRWLAAQGKPQEARSEFTTALQIAEKVFGAEHPNYALALADWSGLDAPGKPEALADFERALGIARTSLGEGHPSVAKLEVALAGFRLAQGQAGQAVPLLEKALQTQRARLVADDPAVAQTLDRLAAALRTTSPERAESLAREAAALRAQYAARTRGS